MVALWNRNKERAILDFFLFSDTMKYGRLLLFRLIRDNYFICFVTFGYCWFCALLIFLYLTRISTSDTNSIYIRGFFQILWGNTWNTNHKSTKYATKYIANHFENVRIFANFWKFFFGIKFFPSKKFAITKKKCRQTLLKNIKFYLTFMNFLI